MYFCLNTCIIKEITPCNSKLSILSRGLVLKSLLEYDGKGLYYHFLHYFRELQTFQELPSSESVTSLCFYCFNIDNCLMKYLCDLIAFLTTFFGEVVFLIFKTEIHKKLSI